MLPGFYHKLLRGSVIVGKAQAKTEKQALNAC